MVDLGEIAWLLDGEELDDHASPSLVHIPPIPASWLLDGEELDDHASPSLVHIPPIPASLANEDDNILDQGSNRTHVFPLPAWLFDTWCLE